MNANANDVTKISDSERDAFRHALELYYTQGPPIAAAFDQVEAGLIDRYYRRKKKYPDEIERIDREARFIAQREVSGEQFAFESRQLIVSREIQHAAVDNLLELLPVLDGIARGEPRVVDGKTVVTYPRDMIAAMSVLCSIARNGVTPESYARATRMLRGTDREEKEEPREPMIPVLGVNTNFSRVTAVAPDGTEIVAEVKRGDVLEAEVEECS
jgi:hypothetical protein